MMVLTIFDYYDGVTEGILETEDRVEFFYFKIIAWDNKQDVRLFIKIALEKSEYDSFRAILFPRGNTRQTKVDWAKLSEEKVASIDDLIITLLSTTDKCKIELIVTNQITDLSATAVHAHKALMDTCLEQARKREPLSLKKLSDKFHDVKSAARELERALAEE